MASIQPQPTSSKRKALSVRIDMTPMVDLGFLLITFFIFTTSLSQPHITKLVMPADGPPTAVKESRTITALLAKDKVYIYNGQWEKAAAGGLVIPSGYSVATGLGTFIRQKQTALAATGQRDSVVFIIKPLSSATYQNVVAAIDEVTINNLQYYAVATATKEEEAYVTSKGL